MRRGIASLLTIIAGCCLGLAFDAAGDLWAVSGRQVVRFRGGQGAAETRSGGGELLIIISRSSAAE